MTPTTASRVAAWTLLGIAGFQSALACGAPWGAAAYGGAHAGVLPAGQRVTSAVAAGVYVALAGLVAGRYGSPVLRRRAARTASVLMGVAAIANLASPSLVERLVWVPVSVVAAVALWRAAAPAAERLATHTA